MSLYEPLFRKVLFPAYESALRRRHTLSYLHEYDRDQWLRPDQLQDLQWSKLQRLVAHCWSEVPYYRECWGAAGVADPRDIATTEDYARLPLLTKADIRANFEQMIAPTHRQGLLFKTTGGSTGEPFRFGYTRESYERRLAVMWRGYGWAGARLGQRTLYLWGTSLGQQKAKDRLYHAAFNRRVLNSFVMSESNMAGYADAIDDFHPEVIVSYVGPLVKLAQWLEASGRRVHQPLRVLCAAEALLEHQRTTIERVFGCPAFNTYGCREFMLIASECEHRTGLHLTADHLKVEIPQPAGGGSGPGEIVVTDLHNYGMPLMRYVNGDLATARHGACACGRGLPMLARVDGRKLDALYTADGRIMPGEYVVYAFLNTRGVKHYQVVQKQLDALEVVIVRDVDFEEGTVELVRNELRKVLGDGIALDFRFADEIPLTATGKLRVTVSELAPRGIGA